MDFRKIFGPDSGFSNKKGFKICDPQISWYPFGTKNHEMREPPVVWIDSKRVWINSNLMVRIDSIKWYGLTQDVIDSLHFCFDQFEIPVSIPLDHGYKKSTLV